MYCPLCKLRPTELEMLCDTMVCNHCEDKHLKEKNPYISAGKMPFLVLKIEDMERQMYLKDLKEFSTETE